MRANSSSGLRLFICFLMRRRSSTAEAKYGREVIDRVRVDEANRLKDDKKARKVVKSARWLLLRNRDTIKNVTEPKCQRSG